MPELKVVIQVEIDGVTLPNFPYIGRLNLTEGVPLDTATQAADNNTTSFHQVPGSVMSTLQALVLTADQAFNLKFNNASYLPMNANGIVVIIGANVAAGATTNATINIPGASTAANLSGGSFGT